MSIDYVLYSQTELKTMRFCSTLMRDRFLSLLCIDFKLQNIWCVSIEYCMVNPSKWSALLWTLLSLFIIVIVNMSTKKHLQSAFVGCIVWDGWLFRIKIMCEFWSKLHIIWSPLMLHRHIHVTYLSFCIYVRVLCCHK